MLRTASLVLQHLRGPMSVPTDKYCGPLEGRDCAGHASAGLVQCLKHSRCSIGICQIKKKKKEGHWCLERLHNFLRIMGSDLSIQMKVIHFPSQGVNPQIIVLEYKSQRTYIYSIPLSQVLLMHCFHLGLRRQTLIVFIGWVRKSKLREVKKCSPSFKSHSCGRNDFKTQVC